MCYYGTYEISITGGKLVYSRGEMTLIIWGLAFSFKDFELGMISLQKNFDRINYYLSGQGFVYIVSSDEDLNTMMPEFLN